MNPGIVPAHFTVEGDFVEGLSIDLFDGDVVLLGEGSHSGTKCVHA